jgi:hypothetical protein
MLFNARLIGGQVNILLTKESDFLRDGKFRAVKWRQQLKHLYERGGSSPTFPTGKQPTQLL